LGIKRTKIYLNWFRLGIFIARCLRSSFFTGHSVNDNSRPTKQVDLRTITVTVAVGCRSQYP